MNIYRVLLAKNRYQLTIHFGINSFRFVFNHHLQRKSKKHCNIFFLYVLHSSAHSKFIDESCSIFLQQFETINPKTHNYGTLIQVFIRLASAVRDDCDE